MTRNLGGRPKGQHNPFNTDRNEKSVQHAIWSSMRILAAGFQVGELLATIRETTGTTFATVYTYVRFLHWSGYLARRRVTQQQKPVFWLIRNSGPLAPVVRKRAGTVFDPNTGEVHPCSVRVPRKGEVKHVD